MATKNQEEEKALFEKVMQEFVGGGCLSYPEMVAQIVLFGDSNTGKTQTLWNLLDRLASFARPASYTQQNIRVVLHPVINKRRTNIFVSTFGDTVQDVYNNILFYTNQPKYFKVYDFKNGQFMELKENYNPTLCIGAARVDDMHWDLYRQFVNTVQPQIRKEIMFRKKGVDADTAQSNLAMAHAIEELIRRIV